MNKEIRNNEFNSLKEAEKNNMHSDYSNEEGSTSEEEAVGSFCGSVLLSEDVWDKEKLISDLKADWEIEL